MRDKPYKRVVHLRTHIVMLILLAFTGIIVFAPGAANGFRHPLGIQGAAPPAVSLVPDSLDFGDQVIGRRSKAKRITLMNTGGKPLYIDSVSGSGDNWSDFSIVNDTCTGAAVDPNRACVIDVAFAPSDTDERNAGLTVFDNAPDSPQALSLTGNGINSNDVAPFSTR